MANGSDQIWIAEGTYYARRAGTDRTASFTITGDQDGLEVYGGFENGDAVRRPQPWPTTPSSSPATSATATATLANNSYRVLFLRRRQRA